MRLPNGYGSITKLKGNRRKPFIIRKTIGWDIDEKTGKAKQKTIIIGYAENQLEALQMLAEYNKNPFDVTASKTTFEEVYESWSKEKFLTISESNIKAYRASFNCCKSIHKKIFKDIKLAELQFVVDNCGKNYPTLRKLKVMLNQMYAYAMKNEICGKDYSEYVNITKYRDKNPNKRSRDRLSKDDVEKLWANSNDYLCQTILMLIYTGLRVSELLDLKKEDIHIEDQYFDVVNSKTENGIRKVPISDKIFPFFKSMYENDNGCEYLLCNKRNQHWNYSNYYREHFLITVKNLGIDCTPHYCRHTCISMLADAHVDQTIIKKIVGHAGAMSLTERVYTHLDIQELIDAINKI